MIFLYITTLSMFINFNQIIAFYETTDNECVIKVYAGLGSREVVEKGKCSDYFWENTIEVGGKGGKDDKYDFPYYIQEPMKKGGK